jgi:NAD(P)-dependent dehydrogenase (short-subunit alcohol dehydrogenase family)
MNQQFSVCRNSLCYITYLVRPTCGNNNSKVAVVTGASRGIGKAIAIEFAKSDYCIMINDFEKEEKLKSTVEEISRLVADDNHNTKVASINGHVSQEKTCVYLMEQTINTFGRIDVLINNASIAEKMATREKDHALRPLSSPANLDTSRYKQPTYYFTLEELKLQTQV